MSGSQSLSDTVMAGENNTDFRLKAVVVIFAAVSCLLINLPWHSLLPADTVIPEYAGWVLPGLLFLVMAISGRMVFSRAPLLLLSFLVLTLPLLWMPPGSDAWRAVTRVLMMWCGGVFLLWLAASRVSEALSALAADALIVTGLVCAVSVLLCVLWPAGYAHWLPLQEGLRPSGGFRQINVMASFLATMLVLSLHRWLFCGQVRYLGCLVIFMVSLVMAQSTIGLLGATVVALLMTVAGRRAVRGRLSVALAVLAVSWAGTRTGMTLMSLQAPVDHTFGQLGRIQMWRACAQLIASHPWRGVGYGMFEGRYPDGVALLQEVQRDPSIVVHPHNELVYQVTEGGLVAVVGLAFLLVWGVRVALRLWVQASAAGGYGKPGSDALGPGLCALPVLLHTQVEYPWYLSGVHFVLSLFLFGLALSRMAPALPAAVLPSRIHFASRALLAIAGVFLVWFSLTGTLIRVGIDAAKQTMATDISLFERVRWLNPWFMPDQQAFVVSLHDMQLFNQDGDPARPGRAEQFYRDYLLRHPDPNVYAMYLQVLSLDGKTAQAKQVYDEARRRVGWDSRFSRAPDNKEEQQ
ncbi:Wzy polymerase domain-containing protein [Enterobacter cloacae complex sp. ESBL7]|uniref:PglL family O-oligosaccharyltransferase n=1 Tax=Enterobacter cloacae complex sp. ESBL7 TaxID=3163325 RepID=UPI003564C15C